MTSNSHPNPATGANAYVTAEQQQRAVSYREDERAGWSKHGERDDRFERQDAVGGDGREQLEARRLVHRRWIEQLGAFRQRSQGLTIRVEFLLRQPAQELSDGVESRVGQQRHAKGRENDDMS